MATMVQISEVSCAFQPSGNLVRNAPPPPKDNTALPQPIQWIYFRHPGCAMVTKNVFFQLPAYDRDPESRKWGVLHQVALDALSILALNKPGFVSTDSDGTKRVDRTCIFLTERFYYFHVDVSGSSSSYQVVDSFQAWEPPTQLPTHWTVNYDDSRRERPRDGRGRSHMSAAVKNLDNGQCIMSYYALVENAHLVPASEDDWFVYHAQQIHNSSGNNMSSNDVSNGISLRPDIHRAFDAQYFVITPMLDSGHLVTYFIDDSPDYAGLFHRVIIKLPPRIARQHVFSRFAFNVIRASNVGRLPKEYRKQAPVELLRAPASRQRIPKGVNVGSVTSASISEDHEMGEDEALEHADAVVDAADIICDPAYHERACQKFYASYPQLREEVLYSEDPDWENRGFHTEIPKMVKLKKEWFRNHPNIRQLSDGSVV